MTSRFSVYSQAPRRPNRRKNQRPKDMGTGIFKKQGSTAIALGRINPNSAYSKLSKKCREARAEAVRKYIEAGCPAVPATYAILDPTTATAANDEEEDEGHKSTDDLFEESGDESKNSPVRQAAASPVADPVSTPVATAPTLPPAHVRTRRLEVEAGKWGAYTLQRQKETMEKPAALSATTTATNTSSATSSATSASVSPTSWFTQQEPDYSHIVPKPKVAPKPRVVLALPPAWGGTRPGQKRKAEDEVSTRPQQKRNAGKDEVASARSEARKKLKTRV
ncbi:hypothetical protein Q7P37_002964 [Cladosporium fusiforme]